MENNKTILQIVPALNTGGVERGVLEISKFIVQNNFRSIVISSGGKLEYQVTKTGGIHYRMNVFTKNPLKWKSLRTKIEEIIKIENVNLIHVCSRVPAWIASPLSTKLNIPLITSVHSRLRKQNFLKNYYNSVLVRGNYIIAISKHIQKSITHVYPEAESKIRVIYRGVDQTLFNKSKIPVSRMVNQLKQMEIQDEKSIIMMASRPKLWKGQLILIEALSKVKQDFQCILIGSGDGKPAFQKKLINLINKFDLGTKIRLTPSTSDIQAAFMMGDIIVMPSIDPEPFGRIIVEGQSLEKIVIGFDHGGLSETIIDGETGFLAKPVCVSSLAEKIELALNLDENKRKNITKSAKKNVEKNFSHVKMCNDTFQLYKKCLNEHKIKYEIK
tara:strand:- start:1094 stop:2251 length:1158 start_codon:yes stop_codon:yes gene_type:complete